jgi:hypothetical protein
MNPVRVGAAAAASVSGVDTSGVTAPCTPARGSRGRHIPGGVWGTAPRLVTGPLPTTQSPVPAAAGDNCSTDQQVQAEDPVTDIHAAVAAVRPRTPAARIAPESKRRRRRTDLERTPGPGAYAVGRHDIANAVTRAGPPASRATQARTAPRARGATAKAAAIAARRAPGSQASLLSKKKAMVLGAEWGCRVC